uniref:ATP-dependent Clp protease proteolytic subunit n=1 Tax=Chlamydomonas nivalis TaxID=47906 RepID=A0A0S2IBJ6_9CHLO|nr:proteolytic subunit 2 of clp protease [Chlamydomonas nivalis]
MPIGVPRIIYCWGEELPPQWTDIYNFIFRRRMVFLMQYLDDELCNQICGLLINIHMEDRSKELEKKEIEKSGIFKSANKSGKESSPNSSVGGPSQALFDAKKDKQFLELKNNEAINDGKKRKKDKSMEDLLSSYASSAYEEDLAIDENYTLEQYTLQKITLEWLNWNAQFFDYSDEPYLFYLAEILSKDFTKDDTGQLFYNFTYAKTNQNNKFGFVLPSPSTVGVRSKGMEPQEGERFEATPRLLAPFPAETRDPKHPTDGQQTQKALENLAAELIKPTVDTTKFSSIKKNAFQEYWPFRSILNLANLISKDQNFTINNLLPQLSNNKVINQALLVKNGSLHPYNSKQSLPNLLQTKGGGELLNQFNQLNQKPGLTKLLGVLASKEFVNKNTNSQKQQSVATKVLGQRNLKKEYALDNNFNNYGSLSSPAILSVAPTPSSLRIGRMQGQEGDTPLVNVLYSAQKQQKKKRALNYLDFDSAGSIPFGGATKHPSYSNPTSSPLISAAVLPVRSKDRNGMGMDGAKQINKYKKNFSAATRKQTKRALQEEESKKVFVIINSFGGSVGNGITVHDALQFIKAGSLTLGLGVAASAASLVLAGGTISERYVTEGCHTMIHQPEGGLNGQASDIWIDSQEIMKIRLDVAEIYSLSAHRPRHKILRDLDRDFYLTATETIHYGLADEIATNDVMHQIIEMTSKVWDYHDSKQQRLLETRNSANSVDTQTQS